MMDEFLTIYGQDYVKKFAKRPLAYNPEQEYPNGIVQGPFTEYLHPAQDWDSYPQPFPECEPLDKFFNKVMKTTPLKKGIKPERDMKYICRKRSEPEMEALETIMKKQKEELLRSVYQSEICHLGEALEMKKEEKKLRISLSKDWICPPTTYRISYKKPEFIKAAKLSVTRKDNLKISEIEKNIRKVTTGKSEYSEKIGDLGESIIKNKMQGFQTPEILLKKHQHTIQPKMNIVGSLCCGCCGVRSFKLQNPNAEVVCPITDPTQFGHAMINQSVYRQYPQIQQRKIPAIPEDVKERVFRDQLITTYQVDYCKMNEQEMKQYNESLSKNWLNKIITTACPSFQMQEKHKAVSYGCSKKCMCTKACRKVEAMSNFIGPALPPHLSKKGEETLDKSDGIGRSEEYSMQDNLIGPAVTSPPGSLVQDVKGSDEDNSILELHAEISDEEFKDDCEDGSKDMYGPALPPGLKVGQSSKTIGPQLPSGYQQRNFQNLGTNVNRPSSEGVQNSDNEEEIVGPMPATEDPDHTTYLQAQLDRRAMKMKRKLAGEEEGGSGPPKREIWMLELPPDQAAAFGLGPRQFRARAKPDPGDRSVWTDTPADRAKKNNPEVMDHRDQSELEIKAVSERNEAMQHLVDKHERKKKKKESLLEIHKKELKKKKKKDKEAGKCEERRPFSREIDLQTNRFDEAQKKSIIKKAQLLNDRFSSGQSKFL